MKLFLLFLCVFGLAHGCKMEMGCAQCTSLSCFYVQLGGFTLCVENPSSFVDLATILTIPSQCPTTSSTFPTTHQSSSSSPASHHPSASAEGTDRSNISTTTTTTISPEAASSPALLIITISIIIIIIIIIITMAGAYLCKQRQSAIESRFARLIDEEETTV